MEYEEQLNVLHQQQDQYEDKNEQQLMAYKEQLQKLEQEQEYYQKENENQKLEHAELVQKLSKEREHYRCNQLVDHTQEENGNLQADIKLSFGKIGNAFDSFQLEIDSV